MRIFVILSVVALLLPGCSGLRIGAHAERMGKPALAKGRVIINIRVIDVNGKPVPGVPVTLITDRNETVMRSTQSIRPELTGDDTGASGLDLSQSYGTVQFIGLLGPVRTVEVWVSGYATTFSEIDIEKGWDPENNVVNLVVRHWGVGGDRGDLMREEAREEREVLERFWGWKYAWERARRTVGGYPDLRY